MLKCNGKVKVAELHRERDTDIILFNVQITFPANFIDNLLVYVYL